ncbi:hypothetical protein EC2021H102_47800 [Escherichia coli]
MNIILAISIKVLARALSFSETLHAAIAEIGRADKTIHMLTYLDDENKRRRTLQQLNRGEGRHAVARNVFHGRRGELRQAYREGQEDQLGALGLVLNIIVLWNTIYMDAAIQQLRREGYPVLDSDVEKLSLLQCGHINMQGRYSFTVTDLSLPPHYATSCKYNMSCCIHLLMTLYVVLFPLPVMRRAGAENSDMIISSAWYPSGNTLITEKSDLPEMVLR